MTQLDGVRGLAILAVTIYRFGRDIPADSWSGRFFASLVDAGQHGVELFFVLSGFLITGVLLDSSGAPNQLRNFFIRRSLRILPLYFATLAVMAVSISALSSTGQASWLVDRFSAAYSQQVYLWLYLTNIHMSLVGSWCFGPLDHFWSLAVEEHFYFVWPFIVVWLLPRQLWPVALIGAAFAVGLRTSWLAVGGSATTAEVSTAMRCDGLLIGAAIAVLTREYPERLRQLRWSSIVGCALFLLAGLLITFSERRALMAGSLCWTLGWSGLMIWLVTSDTKSPVGRLFNLQWLRNLGQLSYAMYVFQSPLIPVVAWLVMVTGAQSLALPGLMGQVVYVASMFALTTGLAWCSWHLFEKHWLRLKEIFPQTSHRGQPTSKVSHTSSWRESLSHFPFCGKLTEIVPVAARESGGSSARG